MNTVTFINTSSGSHLVLLAVHVSLLKNGPAGADWKWGNCVNSTPLLPPKASAETCLLHPLDHCGVQSTLSSSSSQDATGILKPPQIPAATRPVYHNKYKYHCPAEYLHYPYIVIRLTGSPQATASSWFNAPVAAETSLVSIPVLSLFALLPEKRACSGTSKHTTCSPISLAVTYSAPIRD